MARTKKVTVMLSEQTKEDLARLSGAMGMTESALVAYIIGQWVYTQKAVTGKVLDSISGNEIKEIIKSVTSEGAGTERT